MTLDLKAIKQRLAAATPGPWTARKSGRYGTAVLAQRAQGFDFIVRVGAIPRAGETEGNIIFIAAAPADIAALIEEVERLQAQSRAAIAKASEVQP